MIRLIKDLRVNTSFLPCRSFVCGGGLGVGPICGAVVVSVYLCLFVSVVVVFMLVRLDLPVVPVVVCVYMWFEFIVIN